MNLSHDHLDVQDAYQAELNKFIERGKVKILTNREFCGLSFQDFNTFWFSEYKKVKEGEFADGMTKTTCEMLGLCDKAGLQIEYEKIFEMEKLSNFEKAKFNVLWNLLRESLLDALDQFLRQSNRNRVIQGFALYQQNKEAA